MTSPLSTTAQQHLHEANKLMGQVDKLLRLRMWKKATLRQSIVIIHLTVALGDAVIALREARKPPPEDCTCNQPHAAHNPAGATDPWKALLDRHMPDPTKGVHK